VARHGALAPYRSLTVIDGEPHLLRDDLAPAGGAGPADRARLGGRPLFCLAHVTDLQLADVQSPARFEFLNRYFADPRYSKIIPVQRPQEALTAHAVSATVRTINALTGPATGLAPQLVVTTGDAIDNAQWNELQAFLALFDGGTVALSPPGRSGRYHGVQLVEWPDDIFWKPDGEAADGPDLFRSAFGFPHHRGLLDLATRRLRSPGLTMGWLSCHGNHEALNQGVGVQTPGLRSALTGGVKPTGLPDGFDHDQALEWFTTQPELFMTGPTLPVPSHPDRRPISRAEFVEAHFQPGVRPAGHGFTERNRRDGTAYYVHDTPWVRLIALDTACLAGGADGCLDLDQARWLEASLAEVHSVHARADGERTRTGNPDRLVVIFSHHGIDTLSNTRGAGPDGVPLIGRDELLALLHRFGNVVLWLNGHTHTNTIRPRPDPLSPGRGFWEVTTCSVVDWPCQARLVELIADGEELSIVCTMIDHHAPARPVLARGGAARPGGSVARGHPDPRWPRTPDGPDLPAGSAHLASLHRELAANMPFGGVESGLAGTASDRNVALRLAAPFPLSRIGG